MTSNIFEINYNGTGQSQNTNALGMREMQARVYEKRTSQYLLVKAPPASGKSRALMFVALDKLANQGIKKSNYCSSRTFNWKIFSNHRTSKIRLLL